MYLIEGLEKNRVDIRFDAPIYNLIGLAFELFFKAIIRTSGASAADLKKLGHNLERLATKSEHVPNFGSLISDINTAQKSYWRTIAKQSRDEFLSSASVFKEIVKTGSNEEIDRQLPSFIDCLKLLNNLYDSPYYTRYFVRSSKRYPMLETLYVPALMLFDRAELPCKEYSNDFEMA